MARRDHAGDTTTCLFVVESHIESHSNSQPNIKTTSSMDHDRTVETASTAMVVWQSNFSDEPDLVVYECIMQHEILSMKTGFALVYSSSLG